MKPPQGSPQDGIVLTFPVPREWAGLRLDRFIQRCIPRLSRTRAQQIVKACAYREDGRRRGPGDRVRYGETVLLVRERFEEPVTPLEYGVLYEDEALFVVNKPAGLPVHPSATYHRNTLSWLLQERFGVGAPKLAHRLDRETSGVLVCTKTLDDERRVKGAFESRDVEKSYEAIARHVISEDGGVVNVPLAPTQTGLHLLMEVRKPSDDDALAAETTFEVIKRNANATHVALYPLTGRQHQLRVHLASMGHPIVGDKLYGPEGVAPFMEYIETGMTASLCTRLGHERHALHAAFLSMEHPRTGKLLELNAPWPHDLDALWQSLETSDAVVTSA